MVLRDLDISKKILFALGGVLVTVFAMCLTVFLAQQVSMDAAHLNTNSANVVDDVDQALGAVHDQNATMRALVLFKQPRYSGRYKTAGKLVEDATADARKNAEGRADVLAELDKLFASIKTWQQQIGDRVIALSSDPDKAEEAKAIAGSDLAFSSFNQIRANSDTVRKQIQDWSDRAQASENRANATVRNLLLAGAAISLAIMVAAWLWLTRAIAEPIMAMTSAMRKLAEGDHGIIVPAMGRKDEVGKMAAAVETFKLAAIEKIHLEKEAAAARMVVEQERARGEATQAETARLQARVVASVATGLEHLSEGDLVFQLSDPFAHEYEKLRTDFNAAVGKLKETIRIVAANSGAIRSGSSDISSAAQDLSHRTEQQAASLEETAAALDQITATVRRTAEGAISARDVVGSAKSDADKGGEVARLAISAMTEIEQSSQKISQIIGVIDEIAFQTNLLALNAGVEAARAGDSGRGFAVVASEVRALAQRSAEAAKDIKGLISTSNVQVERGVSLVAETGQALDRIVNQVSHIDRVVSEIASSAQEQATGIKEINMAVNQMDQVTQQNAAMVQQTTAASQSLAQESAELARLIGHFRVGSDQYQTAQSFASHSPRQMASVSMIKTTGRGGAARKPQPATDADWHEF